MAHADQLAVTMRDADRAECRAGGKTPLEALIRSIEVSLASYTMLIDGEVAAIFGVAPYRRESMLGSLKEGIGWALTSRVVDRHPLTFMRWSRPALAVLRKHCSCLVNTVDASYQGALDWLEVLGFAIGPPSPRGPLSLPFCFVSIGGA